MVSVIVPIYNVEKYLRHCIESIINQTYQELEIILIDDGSPDGSGVICEEYAKKDSRIKVVHKQNEGLGFARNTGLEYVTGDYVCFVDSDDWLEKNAIESWLNAIESNNADMVMCNYQKINDNGELLYRYQITKEKLIFEESDIIKNIFLPMIGRNSYEKEDFTINMCVWTNIYSTHIIKDNHIRFLSEREYLSEDICFNLEYLLHTKKVVMIPDNLYCYRFNPDSLTNRYKGDEFNKAARLYAKVSKWAELANMSEELEYRAHRFFITKVRELLKRLCKSDLSFAEKKNELNRILQSDVLKATLAEYPLDRYILKYRIPALLMKYNMKTPLIFLFKIR